jgi:hypothetical protein
MRGILRILLYIFTIVLGLFLAAVDQRPEIVDQVAGLAKTVEGRWVVRVAAMILLSSPLMILMRWVQSIRRNREISYETDNGKISVSLVAIEEALTRAIEGEPEVKKAHVRIFEDQVKRAIVIDAIVTMWEVPNVTDRNRFCQRLLRRRFAELMPEQSQVDVNLHLHRLTERRVEAKPSPKVVAAVRPSLAVNESTTGSGSGSSTVKEVLRNSSVNPLANALAREPDESELYVGPTYPVEADEEEDDELPRGRRR